MKKLLLLSLLCAMSNLGRAQAGYILYVNAAPSGTCSAGSYQRVVIGPGTVYTCQSGTWAQISGGGGGSVSSVFTRTGAVVAETGDYTVSQVTGAAALASPTFTGTPIVPTASLGTSTTQAASTAFVAAALAGVNPAVAVQAATTAAGNTSGLTYSNGVSGIGATLTGTANTAITIDGYTFTAVGQRLLVKNDTQSPSGAFNGVYYVTTLQALGIAPVFTRALDYDMPSDMNNTGAIPVINGTVNGSTQWVQSSQVTTVGTDPVSFTKFSNNPSVCQTGVNNSGWCFLEKQTASSSAELDFTACFSSTYNFYHFEIDHLIPATNAVAIESQLFTGGSYDTGTNYARSKVFSGIDINDSGTTVNQTGDIGWILGGTDVSNTTTYPGINGSMDVYNINSTTQYKVGKYSIIYTNSTPASYLIQGGYNYKATPALVTGIRFKAASGNLASGAITCYGYNQ